MTTPKFVALILCLPVLVACATPEGLPPAAPASHGAPPKLIPVEDILAQADALGSSQQAATSVSARAAALREKAALLRRQ